MTTSSRSTVHMLVARAEHFRKEIPIEAQKLLDLYNDPNVTPEQKEVVKRQIEDLIRSLEDRVTTRKLREARQNLSPPEAPAP